jgi:putative ABC transport system permease protein
MGALLQDVRYGIRRLAKSPGFTVVTVLTLALCIGANTAIFSAVNAILIRPLPYKDSSRLVSIWTRSPFFDFSRMGSSIPDFHDIQSQSASLSQISAYRFLTVNLTGQGAPQELSAAGVSPDFFSMLGVAPLRGRSLLASEMQPGQDRVAVLSYAIWRDTFGSDPRAIGRAVTLDDKPYTIVGVMPPAFDFPNETKLWTPLVLTDKESAQRGWRMFGILAHLAPHKSAREAQSELDTIAARLSNSYPDNKDLGFRVAGIQDDLVSDAKLPLMILFGAVACVLLIGCANIGNLSLSRGWARRSELAIRTTLGATRGRLIRQLFVESLLVALLGGACGFILAVWGVDALRAFLPPDTPRLDAIHIDRWTILFAFGASILAGILFGIAPALLVSRQNLMAQIKGSGGATGAISAASAGQRLRRTLVVAEVALALILMIGAVLALRSLSHLLGTNLGFRTDHILTMSLNFPKHRAEKPFQTNPLVQQSLEKVHSLPGVKNAAAVVDMPLAGLMTFEAAIQVEGAATGSAAENRGLSVHELVVTPGYFQTLGIPLLAGRDFSDSDTNGAASVVIVNEEFAHHFFGRASAIGKRISTDRDEKNNPIWSEIVGEVLDIRDAGPAEAPKPAFFTPYYQMATSTGVTLVIETAADPLLFAAPVQQQIWSLASDQAITNVKPMEQCIVESEAEPRSRTILLGSFASLGLLLSILGIYGVTAYSVAQRTREIGIRMALGAQQADVLRNVLWDGAKLTLAGLAIGVVAALALTRFLASLLFEIRATDPITFAAAVVLLAAVALAACYFPARRATRIDPLIALRHE